MHRFCAAAVMTLMVTLSSSVRADEQIATTLKPLVITTAASASQRVDVESGISAARPSQRPIVLPALYAGFITLQALDTSYTLRVVPSMATELNPLLRGITKSPTAFVALKAGLTLGAIMHTERLWKDNHRVAAVALMAASNGLMTVVVARNASILRRAQSTSDW